MTDLEDGVAALLADPLDQKTHAQLLDRLTEDTPDPHAAALALVLRHRESDGPRYVYALSCELRGEVDRAACIRTMCRPELRNLSLPLTREGGAPVTLMTFPTLSEQWPPTRLFIDLTSVTPVRCRWPEWPFTGFGGTVQRGFVSAVTCTAADWLRHRHLIVGDGVQLGPCHYNPIHPIESVTLTGTMPKVDRFGNTWMMRHIGPQIIQTVGPGQRVPPGFNAWEHHTPGALRALLEDLDPGITFTLPPANAYEFRNITVPRYSVGAAPTA